MIQDLENISTEELSGIISAYPWYAGARKILCERLAKPSEAALYVSSRSILKRNYAETPEMKAVIEATPERKVFAAGSDFFSQQEYDKVQQEALMPVFTPIRSSASEGVQDPGYLSFCTETLAQVYAQQGYYDQAKAIYSELSLRYPEKNTYFAALIQKMDEEIKIKTI